MNDDRPGLEEQPRERPREQPSPPTSPAPPLVPWDIPDQAVEAGRIDVSSAFGRTLDTFVAEWPTFVALSLPTAVVGYVVQLLALDLRTGSNVAASTVASLLSILVGTAVVLATITAADDVRSGRPLALVSVTSRALARTPAGVGSIIAIVIIVLALLAIPVTFLIITAGTPVFVIPVLVVVLLAIYAWIRWSLAFPAIALEGAGPIDGLRRSWSVMRGNMWRIGVLIVGLYLLLAPVSIASGLLLFSENRFLGPAANAVVTLLVGPIIPIALAVAWGDMTERPTASGAPPADRRARYAFVGLVLAAGILLLVPGVATFVDELPQLGLAGVPVEDRGRIVAGTGRGPLDPCRPTNVKATFGAGEAIYLGGYFDRTILPGGSATLDVFLDGSLIGTTEIRASTQAIACYYELDPLTAMPSGDYVIVVRDAGGTLAEGAFRVE